MGYICSDCKCTEWKGWEIYLRLLWTLNLRVLLYWEHGGIHLAFLQDGCEDCREGKYEHSQPKLQFWFIMKRKDESVFNLWQTIPGLLALSYVWIGDTLLGFALLNPFLFCRTQQVTLFTGCHGLLRAGCTFKRPQLLIEKVFIIRYNSFVACLSVALSIDMNTLSVTCIQGKHCYCCFLESKTSLIHYVFFPISQIILNILNLFIQKHTYIMFKQIQIFNAPQAIISI